ncbi:MAG: hypothetical protein HY904_12655 [Deltaproteobacteria bacterium]|nr:hypothetical protein [Deltaproteobacteria bacterium]
MRGVLGRLGGMVVRPGRTLRAVLQGEGDGVEPLLLALATVAALYPATLTKYALLWRVDPGMAFGKLFSSSGFVWARLANEGAFCGVAALGFYVLGWMARRPVRAWDAVSAGLYLYVPMAVLALVGGLATRAGAEVPWLPQHPVDGWWVLEGGRVHLDRFYLKLVVEMAWPAVAGLWTAWTVWRDRGTAPVAAQ